MGLKDYLRKRTFSDTPEPSSRKTSKHAKLKFVVQEHDATRHHYDFRLEMEGVLKSWAIPKGPSMDPHEHHLAVQTEDHPYDYRNFEGVIPKGNYGAGSVIVWDEGWYEARKGAAKDSEKTLLKELKDGHITFILHGEKLRGEFALIKMHDSDKSWLLVKKGDKFASTSDVTAETESVKSHKDIHQLGGAPHDLSAYPKKAKSWRVHPMLCTPTDQPFDRDNWLFEIKWDGYRAIGTKHSDNIELYSRNHIDFSKKYSPVAEAMQTFTHDVIVDGEIVATDDNGVAHFEWLQNWHRLPKGALQYQIFDILWYNGRDIRTMPLIQRRALLQSILPKNDVLRFSDAVEKSGTALFTQMQQRGLEGMVAKRANSRYQENSRGIDWLKIKTQLRQEVVIGGYTEPRASRKYFGSLLVGVYDNGEFVYVGHSGGGIPDEQRKTLLQKLQKIERKSSPFLTQPKPNAPVHWVSPKIICEMSFSEWTNDGFMRHPKFEGLREDKQPNNIHREKPLHITPSAQTATLPKLPFEPTHLDKIFFPETGITKGDLFAYYQAVAPYILPYINDRPLSLNRMPHGITGESFFQKNHEHLPDWVPHADIFSDSNNKDLRWIVGGKLDTLLYCLQLGAIEVNPWNSRITAPDKPDWIVIDLDPHGVNFDHLIEVAYTVKAVCDKWGIPTYPKTSGKSGLHVFIPMGARYNYEQARNLAHLIAIEVNKRQPELTSIVRDPAKRPGKLYLDYLQNREGQTLAAPYSVRPTATASVSAPLQWYEVKKGLRPTDFTIKNMPARLKKHGDLWKPVLGKSINLNKVLSRIEKTHKPKQ